MKSKYKDCNGESISYGDILRDIHWQKKCPKTDNSPKEPFFMITKLNNKTMMYVSGIDEYVPVDECKLKTDKLNELGSFEIFVHTTIYEWLLKEQQ